jgi:hypothetical protein
MHLTPSFDMSTFSLGAGAEHASFADPVPTPPIGQDGIR